MATMSKAVNTHPAMEAHFDIDRTKWGIMDGSARFFEHPGMHLVFDHVSIQLRIVANSQYAQTDSKGEITMGTKGREIVGINTDKVLALLTKAYADEWFAYYQYWLGAKIAKGPMKEAVIAELMQHAADELRHADLVTTRIIQLGGTPPISPKLWYDFSTCSYDAPEDPYVLQLLQQNIKGEQCAITVYNSMLAETRELDPVTYNMALQILQDEVEHEEDLQALQEDIELMLARRH